MKVIARFDEALSSAREANPDANPVELSGDQLASIRTSMQDEAETLDDVYEVLLKAANHLSPLQMSALLGASQDRADFTVEHPIYKKLSMLINGKLFEWQNIFDEAMRDGNWELEEQAPAVIQGYSKLLGELELIEVLAGDATEEILQTNLFHCIESNQISSALKIIDRLPNFNFKNDHGQTPFEVAHQQRTQGIITKLYERGCSKDTIQFVVMNKMSRLVLDLPGRNPHQSVTDVQAVVFKKMTGVPVSDEEEISSDLHGGLCYGFTTLWMLNPDQFEKDIEKIVAWNGEADTLTDDLRQLIRQVFDNAFYLGSMGSNSMMEGMLTGISGDRQVDTHKLVNLVKDKDKPDLMQEYSFIFSFSEPQLTHALSSIVQKDKRIRIRIGESHWVSIRQTDEGYRYYDPNSQTFYPATKDISQLSSWTVETYERYYQVEDLDENSKYDLSIFAYDYADQSPGLYPDRNKLLCDIVEMDPEKEFVQLKGCNPMGGRTPTYLSETNDAMKTTLEDNLIEGNKVAKLIFWANQGHLKNVERALANGASVNYQDKAGNTALMAAVQQGHLDIALALVNHGADPYLLSQRRFGRKPYTAVSLAFEGKYIKFLEHLSKIEKLSALDNKLLTALTDEGATAAPAERDAKVGLPAKALSEREKPEKEGESSPHTKKKKPKAPKAPM